MKDRRFRMELTMPVYREHQEPTSSSQRRSRPARTRHGFRFGISSLDLFWMLALGCWFFSVTVAGAATNSGLWVGEISLGKVNESVGGINAANQLVFNDP